MRKRRGQLKRKHAADPVYGSVEVTRFINKMMYDGKKSTAEREFYKALAMVGKSAKIEPLAVFEKALENVSPSVEVASRRIGGANYQVPQEVRPERRFILAVRWIVAAMRARSGKPIAERLAEELLAAYKNEGAAVKKKQDIHRMAEANRAFAHFARR